MLDTPKNKKRPNPVDMHVGSRIRLRRTMMSMSQEKLGDSLGITFQQIQKYEKGTNRVGASRLQAISGALKVPVAYFFEGQADEVAVGEVTAENEIAAFIATADGLALNRAFARITNPKIRQKLVGLIRTLAGAEDDLATA
jgi:transcriptional regulator with XRE-family HTH domain